MRLASSMPWAALPALLLLAAPAAARGADPEAEHCMNLEEKFSSEEAIVGCTAMIDSGRYSGANLSGVYNNRGIAYRNQRDNPRALADFSEAIRINPQSSIAYRNRGDIYLRMNDPRRAIADFDEAIRITPAFAAAYQNRARGYGMLGQHGRAAADMRVAVEITPDHPVRQEILCWSLALANEDLAAARAACDASLKLKPDASNTYDSRAMVGLKQKRYQDAWNDYDAAVRLDSKSAHSLYGRGIAALRLGRAAGKADIERARTMDPAVTRQYESYGEAP